MDANMYCDVLKQSLSSSLQKLVQRAVFQHDNEPKHTSKTATVLLKKLRVKVLDWPSMSKPYSLKVEECKVSNVQQLHDVIMGKWKRNPEQSVKL